MLFMVVETFRPGCVEAVYARFRERGRLLPDGLRYVASWVTHDRARCFQLMETDDPALLDVWTARWDDLVAFEVAPVLTSDEAARRVAEGR